MDRAFRGQLFHQGIEQNSFGGIVLQIDKGLPLLGLGQLDVLDHIAWKQCPLTVKFVWTAFHITTFAQLEVDGVLETALYVLAAIAHAAASSANSRTSILPVTAFVMSA